MLPYEVRVCRARHAPIVDTVCILLSRAYGTFYGLSSTGKENLLLQGSSSAETTCRVRGKGLRRLGSLLLLGDLLLLGWGIIAIGGRLFFTAVLWLRDRQYSS